MKWAKNATVSSEDKLQVMKFSCEGIESLEYVLNKSVPDQTKRGVNEYLEELQSPSNSKQQKAFGAAYVAGEGDEEAAPAETNGEEKPEGEDTEKETTENAAEGAEAAPADEAKPEEGDQPAAEEEEVGEEELM